MPPTEGPTDGKAAIPLYQQVIDINDLLVQRYRCFTVSWPFSRWHIPSPSTINSKTGLRAFNKPLSPH